MDTRAHAFNSILRTASCILSAAVISLAAPVLSSARQEDLADHESGKEARTETTTENGTVQDGKRKMSAEDFRTFVTDSLDGGKTDIMERLMNLPNIEVGKGVTFRPKNNSYEMTIRFRMQNMVGLSFNRNMTLTSTDAQVKRLRLRFDGYIFSPKIVYSIQLGFSSYDTEIIPNGNMNLIRDAIVYYVPGPSWNIGFGQTKIKGNRARVNSSSALQFIDRSIVNSEFGGDRDFGFFGEYNYGDFDSFALSAKGSVTLGEGRNFNTSSTAGFAYNGRLELYPLGRFHGNGELLEGDVVWEETPKIMLAGAYTFNDNALRTQGMKGSLLPSPRDIGSYYFDFILKYRGFAFVTDFMGRHVPGQASGIIPSGDGAPNFIYTGCGVNVQTSYLFDRKWEVALRNSTMLPDAGIQPLLGYASWNQSTIGVTRYLIRHSLKLQMDLSYNYRNKAMSPDYDRWMLRFQVELGL